MIFFLRVVSELVIFVVLAGSTGKLSVFALIALMSAFAGAVYPAVASRVLVATSILASSVVSSVRTAVATVDALGAVGIAAIAAWMLDSSAGSGGRLSVLALMPVIEALSGAVYEAESSLLDTVVSILPSSVASSALTDVGVARDGVADGDADVPSIPSRCRI